MGCLPLFKGGIAAQHVLDGIIKKPPPAIMELFFHG